MITTSSQSHKQTVTRAAAAIQNRQASDVRKLKWNDSCMPQPRVIVAKPHIDWPSRELSHGTPDEMSGVDAHVDMQEARHLLMIAVSPPQNVKLAFLPTN